jgi:two-component system sensor histidine kinase KdpD
MVGAAAVAAHFCEPYLAPQSLALIFVAPMVVAAMRYGLRAALAASLLSVAAINFLFVEPRYTLVVARVQDLGALLLFAAVSVLVSFIAERARSPISSPMPSSTADTRPSPLRRAAKITA